MIAPAAFFLPLPTRLGLAGGSGAIHLVYLCRLIKAFEGADMMVAYPILRGVAPALAAVGRGGVFREP